MAFTWDKRKAVKNERKHGITFVEAETVFDDPYFVVLTDDDHSFNEQRYWIIGESTQNRILLVVYVERGDVVRIINACGAAPREIEIYEEEKYRSIG